MITGESYDHYRTDAGLPVHWHNAIGNAPHGENRRLGRIDDGAESVNLIHPKIADSESRARNVGRAQTACPGRSALWITAATAPPSTAIATPIFISGLRRMLPSLQRFLWAIKRRWAGLPGERPRTFKRMSDAQRMLSDLVA